GKVDSSKALDDSLVVTECSAIESENSNSEHVFNKSVNESSMIDTGKQDTSSSSGNYSTHAMDTDIRPANDQVPFAEGSYPIRFLQHLMYPTNKELEILFQLMFDEYLEPPRVKRPVSPALAVPVPVNLAGTPSSTTIDQDAPSLSHLPSSLALKSPSLQQGVAAESTIMEDNLLAPVDNDPFIN
nr:hypothetical protein [Tanacetum cinerariifolium]